MKIYKLNSLMTFLFIFFISGIVLILPSGLIQLLWNTTVARTYSEISIDFWQALILWLILIVVLNILGIFKFEFAIETREEIKKELFSKDILKNGQEKGKLENEIKESKEQK